MAYSGMGQNRYNLCAEFDRIYSSNLYFCLMKAIKSSYIIYKTQCQMQMCDSGEVSLSFSSLLFQLIAKDSPQQIVVSM